MLSTAVAAVRRGLSVSSQVYGSSLFTAVRKLSTSLQPNEEEDVLYKMCELECRGVDPAVLRSYSIYTQRAARELGIEIGKCVTPKKPHLKRWSVLKSVFIHVKAQAQYEVRTYHHTMQFLHLTGSTADTFLEYVQRNLPEGVSMKVTRVRLERLPEHLKTPPNTNLSDETETNETPPKQLTE